ncbi:MAG: hypothetical protein M1817_001804 [Caeruleum heppii]|nr:MAG: hypothetical protein M1817_001804 [Caeruleum heppii]
MSDIDIAEELNLNQGIVQEDREESTKAVLSANDQTVGSFDDAAVRLHIGTLDSQVYKSYLIIKCTVKTDTDPKIKPMSSFVKLGAKTRFMTDVQQIQSVDQPPKAVRARSHFADYVNGGLLWSVKVEFTTSEVLTENLYYNQIVLDSEETTRIRRIFAPDSQPDRKSITLFAYGGEELLHNIKGVDNSIQDQITHDPVLAWHTEKTPLIQSGMEVSADLRPKAKIPAVRVFADFTEYMTLNGYACVQEREYVQSSVDNLLEATFEMKFLRKFSEEDEGNYIYAEDRLEAANFRVNTDSEIQSAYNQIKPITVGIEVRRLDKPYRQQLAALEKIPNGLRISTVKLVDWIRILRGQSTLAEKTVNLLVYKNVQKDMAPAVEPRVDDAEVNQEIAGLLPTIYLCDHHKASVATFFVKDLRMKLCEHSIGTWMLQVTDVTENEAFSEKRQWSDFHVCLHNMTNDKDDNRVEGNAETLKQNIEFLAGTFSGVATGSIVQGFLPGYILVDD